MNKLGPKIKPIMVKLKKESGYDVEWIIGSGHLK